MVFVLLWLVYHDGSEKSSVSQELAKKKRALAVLTEKAMANRPRKGCPFMMSIP